jgi:hypothetical protein
MPTAAKPPPEPDVAQLVLGLFTRLRDKGHTTATVPGLARSGVATALARGTLDGLAKTMATAFRVALDTWIYRATPLMQEKHQRSAKKELASTLTNWLRDDESRSEAIRILQAFPLSRFSALIEQIADSSADRAARAGASIEDQQRTREPWIHDSSLFAELFGDLGRRLRAPRGVPFPRTLKEWTHFEQKFVQRLRRAGLSYGDIAKLRRSAARGGEALSRQHRLERERVRGSARRAKARKA